MKNIKYLLFTIITAFLFINNANAASGTASVSVSKSNLTVGDEVTVTLTVSSSVALGYWDFRINYDTSKLSLVSGNTRFSEVGNGSQKSASNTIRLRATSPGTASISITKSGQFLDFANEQEMSVSYRNTSVNITSKSSGGNTSNNNNNNNTGNKQEVEKSKNNNLKQLEVVGYSLNPKFDKNTTTYKVEIPEEKEKVTINAIAEDVKATVTGNGEVNLTNGTNKFEIKVVSENGDSKTYKLEIKVEDKNPITFKYDSKTYTVIKNNKLLTKPTGFEETKVKINNIEVPAYVNNKTNMRLIGAKDENGNIVMFVYDNNKYNEYIEVASEKLVLYIANNKKIPEGFKKSKIVINEKEYNCYVSNTNKDFILVYAMNVNTGKYDFYQYSKKDKTFISYNSDFYKSLNNNQEKYKKGMFIAIGIACILLLTTLLFLILSIKNKKKYKPIKETVPVVKEKKKVEKKKRSKKNKELDIDGYIEDDE